MAVEENIPGVVFYLEKATSRGAPNGQEIGQVVLEAHINDVEVWEEAKKRLSELKIHTVDDVKSELIDMFKEKAEAGEERLEKVKEDFRQGNLQLLQKLDDVEKELERSRQENLALRAQATQYGLPVPTIPSPFVKP